MATQDEGIRVRNWTDHFAYGEKVAVGDRIGVISHKQHRQGAGRMVLWPDGSEDWVPNPTIRTATDDEVRRVLPLDDARVVYGGRPGTVLSFADPTCVLVEFDDGDRVRTSVDRLEWDGKAEGAPPPTPTDEERSTEAFAAAMAERDERMWELAARPSSWAPVSAQALGLIADGSVERPRPSVFRRDDGVCLLYRGRMNAFLGEPEGCKTWAALVAVAQEVAAGNTAVLVDYEDAPETAVERLMELGLTAGQVAEGLVYVSPTEPFDEVAMAHLESRVLQAAGNLTIAVVDSMTEAMTAEGLDPTRGTDVARFHRSLPRWLADQGAAVVLIDHVTKSNEGRGRWAIGSERKISGLDGAAYAFETVEPFGRGVTGRSKITVSKDRGGYVRQHARDRKVIAALELVSSPEDGSVTARLGVPGTPSTSDVAAQHLGREAEARQRVWDTVKANPGLGSRDLRAKIPGNGRENNEALKWLVEQGHVEQRTGAGGSRLHHPSEGNPYAP